MATNASGYPGIYNAVPITLADGEGSPLAVNENGELVVNLEASTVNIGKIRPDNYATDDSAMPATPVTMPVSGEYRSSVTTYTDGDVTVLQSDVNGFLKNVEQYAPGYEDNTNNKAIVEHRYTYAPVMTGDTQVKASAGFLHTVTFSCNDSAPTAGSIIIYDNTAESGTQVFNVAITTTYFNPFTVLLDYTMATGIYVGFTTTADVNVSCSYR